MLGRLKKQAGDTLIEVLFAISIFATIMLGTIIIMNQGISSAQNALEINLVRNQMDTQAELLRHLNNAKLNSIGRASTEMSREWDRIVATASTEARDYGEIQNFDQCSPTVASGGSVTGNSVIPDNAFFINPRTGMMVASPGEPVSQLKPVQTFAQVQPDPTSSDPNAMVSNMIWVQAVRSGATAEDTQLRLTSRYDFHIRACWDSVGAGAGLMKLGTIVRLYVPNE